MLPGDTDWEGLGGTGQWFMYTLEKRCRLGPDRTCFIIKRLKSAESNISHFTEMKQFTQKFDGYCQ
jgi:hypothetical protein